VICLACAANVVQQGEGLAFKLNRQQIHERAMQVLEASPKGTRWTDLLKAVEAVAPDTPNNSI